MRNARRKTCSFLLQLTAALLSLFWSPANAFEVDAAKADKAARQWLRHSPALGPMPEIKSIEKAQFQGKAVYYVVNLSPSGFILLSPDERLEPIIAFASAGQHVPNEESPLYKFARVDIAARLNGLKYNGELPAKNAAKWKKYLNPDLQGSEVFYLQEELDIRVEPLIRSIWGQQDEAGLPCYNYYIPPGSEPDGDPNNNIRCGCVAAAMAQVMRYHQHPSGPVGVSAFSISVSGSSYTAYTRGGDGAGGPYSWYNMPLDPNQFTNDVQRRAIGALCHDAGLTVNMSYSPSGSGAAMRKIHGALSGFFRYSCAVYGIGSFDFAASANADATMALSMPTADIDRMINPGLDAGYPSILGIDGPAAGHAVVIDGYRYEDGTLYHHLNMGWYGRDNAWYALPDVNSMPSYDVIDACIYNIFPDGTGEIVSGRVFDAAGVPVENAAVLALLDDAVVQQSITNQKGMYALAHLPSEHTYVLRAEKEGCRFAEQVVYVGKSTSQGQPYSDVTGNLWGVDFHHPCALPPFAIEPAEPNVIDSNSVTIVLKATDEGLPNPPGRIRYMIDGLPQHGRLYDPNFGEIVTIPHNLRNDSNSVRYEPCRYFFGMDSFSFKANDGGIPPDGGDSNSAEIWLNIIETEIGATGYFSDYPLHTWKQDSRTQLIYTAQELGPEKVIGAMSLNILQPPPNLLSRFRLRMQHTLLDEYQTDRDFIHDGWTTVYEADELIWTSGWRRFNFQTPFHYDGTANILFDISFDNSAWAISNGLVYGMYAANQDMSQSSDSQHGDPRFWTVSMFGGYLSENIKPSLKVHTYVADVPAADFNVDCSVDLPDMLQMAGSWLSCIEDANYSDVYDIGRPADHVINGCDFAVLASEWLQSYD